MNPDELPAFLTQIKTQWSHVFRAQQGDDESVLARQELLLRYHEAVYRYLLARLPRDPHLAGELYSDFAVRALSAGGFLEKADRGRGRFRYLLKTMLNNMITDHYRKKGRKSEPVPIVDSDQLPPGAEPPEDAEDEAFYSCWRQEMLNRAYES